MAVTHTIVPPQAAAFEWFGGLGMRCSVFILRTIRAQGLQKRRYLGDFTSAGVGEGPFAIDSLLDEIRNGPPNTSQHMRLQSFTGTGEEVRNSGMEGDRRAETFVELS